MRLIIRDNEDQTSLYTALYIAQRIKDFAPTAQRPFVLGLPTGSTPILTYVYLVEMHRNKKVDLQHVVTFNMDEYWGLGPDHDQSYRYFMQQKFFRDAGIVDSQVNFLSGIANDAEAECQRYEDNIKALGGIELFLAGIGDDGHVAFNEPGSSLASRTRLVRLTQETIAANARFFEGQESQVPKLALTIGVGTILEAREVVLLVHGQKKALALSKCIEEGVNHMWTASALQLHPRATIVCDKAATMELRVKTVTYAKEVEDQVEGKKKNGFAGH